VEMGGISERLGMDSEKAHSKALAGWHEQGLFFKGGKTSHILGPRSRDRKRAVTGLDV